MALRVVCQWTEDVIDYMPLFQTCKSAREVLQVKNDSLRAALRRAHRHLELIPRDHMGSTATLRIIGAMMDACVLGQPRVSACRFEEAAARAPMAMERDIEETIEEVTEAEWQLRRDRVWRAAGRLRDIAAEIRHMQTIEGLTGAERQLRCDSAVAAAARIRDIAAEVRRVRLGR